MMEALIGAVTIDSGWDLEIVSALVDRLLSVQLSDLDRYLKQSYYELFNAWHMRHFGELPVYTVDGRGPFSCIIRFSVPENELSVWRRQILDSRGDTRSHARELAAEFAYHFVVGKGLWISIKESGIEPALEDSINQLQELYQKKYLDELPEYIFEEGLQDNWFCDCICCGIKGWGKGKSKIQAKKQAAYIVLNKLFAKNDAVSDAR